MSSLVKVNTLPALRYAEMAVLMALDYFFTIPGSLGGKIIDRASGTQMLCKAFWS